jgi:hypothetical protein
MLMFHHVRASIGALLTDTLTLAMIAGMFGTGLVIAPHAAFACGMEYDAATQQVYCDNNCSQNQNDPAYQSDYRDKWTSIALSSKAMTFGYSWQADQLALSACKRHASDCKVVEWGENECLALAISARDGAWGTAWDRNGANARAAATAECRKESGTRCVVRADPCAHDTLQGN